ncbi:MAG TPA: HNH endonuclease [Leptolyngbyaceae cyanobacterium M33_DOE_097]|uniref:HNH endonuclease n=1 Tax=Oscillatoriales cyanobacterium SpSt-418 TaxID=2282169 RepID=A0A7C3PHM7_9CYAN|nr:HNH endonuclease [Leptolyngbyaceae cyanobacterium M33_DOE_097]
MKALLLRQQRGKCTRCGLNFCSDDLIEVHHQDGNHGNSSLNNLKLLHRHCHDQAHGAATTPKTGIPDNEPGWREVGCPETGKSGFEAKQVGRPTCLG